MVVSLAREGTLGLGLSYKQGYHSMVTRLAREGITPWSQGLLGRVSLHGYKACYHSMHGYTCAEAVSTVKVPRYLESLINILFHTDRTLWLTWHL